MQLISVFMDIINSHTASIAICLPGNLEGVQVARCNSSNFTTLFPPVSDEIDL